LNNESTVNEKKYRLLGIPNNDLVSDA
jgi:hypothetical protein